MTAGKGVRYRARVEKELAVHRGWVAAGVKHWWRPPLEMEMKSSHKLSWLSQIILLLRAKFSSAIQLRRTSFIYKSD